eukprot:c28885_g1_i1 orf=29-196(-)
MNKTKCEESPILIFGLKIVRPSSCSLSLLAPSLSQLIHAHTHTLVHTPLHYSTST